LIGEFLTLLRVESYFFTVYGNAFDLSICHKLFVKTAFAAINLNILKSEVAGTCSALGNGYVIENVAIAGTILQGYVIYARGKSVIFLLTEKVKVYKASCSIAGDIFHADEFVVLGGIVAELEPEHINGLVHLAITDYDVFIVYRFRAAGKHSVAISVAAIFNKDIVILAVFGERRGIGTLATLQHY
jgi:hypothetical protein